MQVCVSNLQLCEQPRLVGSQLESASRDLPSCHRFHYKSPCPQPTHTSTRTHGIRTCERSPALKAASFALSPVTAAWSAPLKLVLKL